jgi:hypothetical protein
MRRIAFADTEARRPHIVYPCRDMIIALDPDISADRQRLFPREPAPPGLAWQIDRLPVTSPAGTSLAAVWRPVPDRHHLTPLHPDGWIVDSVVFEVRGRR